ncbi:Pectinesterase, catalytic [Dillenia turbinata]|uniref:Pectinesterase n=1 Tax=Dillenia turbinata TaxID=194707 RepID=A0AAN8UKU6_9MAGN
MAWVCSSAHICVALAIILVILATTSNGLNDPTINDAHLLTEKIATNKTIIVDINGEGDFKSVQAAIDSVQIFDVMINDVLMQNEAPTGVAYTSQNQSVAALVGADKVAFYHCGFFSTHNTLFDYRGRHYFDSCYIQGSIDFIFGRGRSIYHNCEIFVISDKRVSVLGSITAHNRESPDDEGGFVFVKGRVYGAGDQVYLGRPKGAYSRVLYANTYLSKTIISKEN